MKALVVLLWQQTLAILALLYAADAVSQPFYIILRLDIELFVPGGWLAAERLAGTPASKNGQRSRVTAIASSTYQPPLAIYSPPRFDFPPSSNLNLNHHCPLRIAHAPHSHLAWWRAGPHRRAAQPPSDVQRRAHPQYTPPDAGRHGGLPAVLAL
ncbi:uncharacterized protein C8Q71DRAFT_189293 [Rhodofomes roseus]|uniref:Secreted protein n=1 Tax=Rhodofomes roseus TaxID=34475 RepID=A0ABQ8K8D2_9APHY|nr:uncharacterized protein C8Q71DRAFT_189293 [Rhodofomes roseus]KAH9833558.1 hypothetical protein C8Q71DRAFT_189293 [Rhodofomes roseus]